MSKNGVSVMKMRAKTITVNEKHSHRNWRRNRCNSCSAVNGVTVSKSRRLLVRMGFVGTDVMMVDGGVGLGMIEVGCIVMLDAW